MKTNKPSEKVEVNELIFPENCKQLFKDLPLRFKDHKAQDFDAIIHFKITGIKGGEFTVTIKDQTCSTQEGLHGESNCLVRVSDETYLGIEKGKVNAQIAFMSGKIKVNNVSLMTKYSSLFKLYKKT
jgi:putative sterol carrier protein